MNGGGFTIYTGAKTNHGTFRIINGGYLEFVGSNLTNYNATTDTLTGGRWEVVSSGPASTMNFGNAPVVTIAPATTVRLSGANAAFAALSSLSNIAGTLVLENGKTLATSGNMTIPGVLHYGLPADTGSTRLAVTGNVNFTGTRVDIHDLGLTSGSYTLASWTGTVTGVPTLGARPPWSQHSLVLDPVAKTLKLEVVVQSPPVIGSFQVEAGSGGNAGMNVVTLTATGVAGVDYQLEVSSELVTWIPQGAPLSSPTGQLTWQFTWPQETKRCFVRIASP